MSLLVAGSLEGLIGQAVLVARPPVGVLAQSSGAPREFVVAASPVTAAAAGLEVVSEVGFGWSLVIEQVSAGVPVEEVAEQLSEATGLGIEPNTVYALADDPLFPDQWSLENMAQTGGVADADIDVSMAWERSTGEGAAIAVLDTGIASSHPDLSSSVWVNGGETPGNGIDDDGNGYIDDVGGWDALDSDGAPDDSDGHGTFVATIAAASVNGIGMAGVAPDSRVMPVRVCSGSGCPLSAILTGLAYAVANGADVVNLSFGANTSPSPAMSQALHDAIATGVIVVAAAGNQGRDIDLLPFYPAGYDIDGLISVAASDHDDQLASFSNFGDQTVDLAAPGEHVIGGALPNGWSSGSGTSFAAPHVSGVVALVRALRPNMSPADVEALLIGSVDLISELTEFVASGGRLNAESAVELATAPVAVAEASPASGILPFTVHLDGAQSSDPLGELVGWSWGLPDGSEVEAAETTWSPTRPGSYEATLTVVDSDGLSDSGVVSITASLRPGGSFIDDNGHFAEGAIEAIAAEGITRGCNPPLNDEFCPEEPVTRGQMAAFLARALDLPPAAVDWFKDDNGYVFEGAINKLAGAGITVGCDSPNQLYCQTGLVTRGQMAAFLARAFDLIAGAGSDIFVDDDGVFENAIDKLATAGITVGCNPPVNDRFCPDEPVTRGEMAVFLARALGLGRITLPSSE